MVYCHNGSSSTADAEDLPVDSDGYPISCFTADAVVRCLVEEERGVFVERDLAVGALEVGDVIRTGRKQGDAAFRRVTRVWESFVQAPDIVMLSEGCRLTSNHPVLLGGGEWRRAGEAYDHGLMAGSVQQRQQQRRVVRSPPQCVYGIELEGHIDTVLCGGVVCAGLGVFCGSKFGWNIFTRKTTWCDTPNCAACAIAVDEKIDFANITPFDLAHQYAPYNVPNLN